MKRGIKKTVRKIKKKSNSSKEKYHAVIWHLIIPKHIVLLWWRWCAEVFFYFLFFIVSILSVILLFMRVVYAEVWSEGSIFFLARLCKQKLCRRRIKGQKRQSSRRTGSASASQGDTTIGQAQKRHRKTTDKKEGHTDTKRHTQQANKQDHRDDLGSMQ